MLAGRSQAKAYCSGVEARPKSLSPSLVFWVWAREFLLLKLTSTIFFLPTFLPILSPSKSVGCHQDLPISPLKSLSHLILFYVVCNGAATINGMGTGPVLWQTSYEINLNGRHLQNHSRPCQLLPASAPNPLFPPFAGSLSTRATSLFP